MLNKDDIARRFGQSATTYDSASTAQQEAVRQLMIHLEKHLATGSTIFEVGCGTGSLTRSVLQHLKPHLYIANDISEGMLAQLRNAHSANLLSTLCGDAETLSWPENTDAIVSASAVQWFDNPLSFVSKSASTLCDGGLMAVATYGPSTFCELQHLGIPGLHYPLIDEWNKAIADAKMQLVASEVSTVVLHYPSALEVMRDLQRAGVTSNDHQLSAGSMRTLMRRYEEQFSTVSGVSLTYEIYIVVARKI